MKKLATLLIGIFLASFLSAQVSTGDTIVVKAFKYGSTVRDTAVIFPAGNLTYEKVLLKYNMRCKNNLVSNSSFPNQGCGEWDYSCNTFLVDSTKIENDLNSAPSHIITNFNGTTFNYSSQTIYDYYNFTQTNVVLNNILSETQYTIGTGGSSVTNFLKSNQLSGRSQILYTAAELTSAGLTAGNIDGFILNVTNAGGITNFMKVGIQNTTLSSLQSNTVTTAGFTNVFNSNFTFTNGNNRIQFYTPFVWNGTSNILIDVSFTNTNPGTAIVLNGSSTPSVQSLYANNNYALDLAALGHVYLNPAMLSSVSNEISITFWAYGKSGALPANTSILYSNGTNNERNLNIHLPWSDNSVYFDCGYASGGYDRINAVSTATQQAGQWNHWAFTKNATTGDMKIYLNGALFQSGTAKTKVITLLNLLLGKDNNLQNNYKGRVNELTLWNKELSLTDIQNWMNKPIDNTHPFYANLLGYYKMNEGNGLTINDTKNSLSATGVNLQWTYDRGDKLVRSFSETNVRPDVIFFNGNYSLTTNTLTVKDSLARNPNIVQQYTVVSNATVVPMANDAVNLVSTTNLYEATPSNVYDGDTGTLTGTIAVTSDGSISITNLSYYNRYPFYNELTSFVTPYGKGLSMGVNGKTWYFDVTDFTPLFTGKKRMIMTMGGENQEQMDLDFIFIVGTPPRNILEFNQLWQGAARLGGVPIASINNDTRFNTLNVPLLNNGQNFKMRSTITGHGSQGEFHQNGGVITHYFNVNGGANEFSWPITQECADNPIMAQGGTWVYDRQGWCPGQASMLKEYEITPYVSPGTTVTLDYNCSNPPVSNGDYRYLAAHQLITYGAPNHNLDAAIIDVFRPSDKVLYSKKNPICAQPMILIQNTGSTAFTSVEFEYWVNNASVKQYYTWTGNLNYMDTVTVSLPVNGLWLYDVQASNNIFNAKITAVNGVADDYQYNNRYSSPFVTPEAVPGEFSIEFKTNNYYYQNNYVLLDDNGNTVGTSNFTAANTTYIDTYTLSGCYKLIVTDVGGDGLQWWANTAQGAGYVRIKNSLGVIVKTFPTDFGNGFEYSFTTDSPLSIEKQTFGSQINLYPNPAQNKCILDGIPDGSQVVIRDILGHSISVPSVKENGKIEFNTCSLTKGIYFVSITSSGNSITKKLVIN